MEAIENPGYSDGAQGAKEGGIVVSNNGGSWGDENEGAGISTDEDSTGAVGTSTEVVLGTCSDEEDWESLDER